MNIPSRYINLAENLRSEKREILIKYRRIIFIRIVEIITQKKKSTLLYSLSNERGSTFLFYYILLNTHARTLVYLRSLEAAKKHPAGSGGRHSYGSQGSRMLPRREREASMPSIPRGKKRADNNRVTGNCTRAIYRRFSATFHSPPDR